MFSECLFKGLFTRIPAWRVICLLAVVCCCGTVQSQIAQEEKKLSAGVRQLALSRENTHSLLKALHFYESKEWDSTLIHAMKQLNRNGRGAISDYCHYFRGAGFRYKHLYTEAERELERVSGQFQYRTLAAAHLADIYLETGKFREALKLYREISPLLDSAVFCHNAGLCYFHLGEYVPAESYLQRAERILRRRGDRNGLITASMDLGNLYYEQYRDQDAIGYFMGAYRLSKQTGNRELRQNAAFNLAIVEENRGNPAAALAYRKEYEAWHDSLNDQNKIWEIAALEKRFAVNRKQKEVDVLRERSERKIAERNLYLTSSVLLVLLLGVIVWFYRQNVRRSALILLQKTELDELNATKDKLFSIVSHDLRSSVHALKTSNTRLVEYLETQNYDRLDEQLRHNSAIAGSTYNLLDNLLHWSLQQTGQFYFQRERHRLFRLAEQVVYTYGPLMESRNIAFSIEVPKNAEVFADAESLKIVLRNLLDNAIKFSAEGDSVRLYVSAENAEHLELVVEDTGAGMSEHTRLDLLRETPLLAKKEHEQTLGTGLGIQLCKALIKRNGGLFAIESKERSGTRIILTLPKTGRNG